MLVEPNTLTGFASVAVVLSVNVGFAAVVVKVGASLTAVMLVPKLTGVAL